MTPILDIKWLYEIHCCGECFMRLAHDIAINYTWTYGFYFTAFYLFTWPSFIRENGLGRYILFLDVVRVLYFYFRNCFFIWSDIYNMTCEIKVCNIKKNIMGNQTKTLTCGVCMCMVCVCVYKFWENPHNIQHKWATHDNRIMLPVMDRPAEREADRHTDP